MTVLRDLLFELGTEELPPKSLLDLSRALEDNVREGLVRLGLPHGPMTAYATPRRLALRIEALPLKQPDQVLERRGPALTAAYQADGQPTPALLGFLKGAGASQDQLITLETDKGAWVAIRQAVKGQPTEALLAELFRGALQSLPVAKRMRWGAGSAEFVRPVHWVVLLLGDAVVSADILGLKTGRTTFGHRVHAQGPITIKSPADYESQLEQAGFVLASFDRRRAKVLQGAEAMAEEVHGTAAVDPDLLDEVTALVEWPIPIRGAIEPRYLALPPEVLMTTLKANQKYFSIHDAKGSLLPYFITFSNLDSRTPETVRAGNERVVRPRLADAEFFWELDQKRSLESRIEDLRQVTFQSQLGSLYDKSVRVAQLAEALAAALGESVDAAGRSARLAKTDLLTAMVGEFPELQGTMGRHYAERQGESPEVALAIEEHYLPKVAGGALPKTPIGRVLALADKLDTLCGIFSVGLVPTGDRDPYALRRAALGILRIAIESSLEIDLPGWIDQTFRALPAGASDSATPKKVLEFVYDRLRGYLLDKGATADEFEAVLAVRPQSPLDFSKRIRAVQAFRALPEAESLSAANKRICNLLKKIEEPIARDSLNAFESPCEQSLADALESARKDSAPLLAQGDYTQALCRLAALKDPIDGFFEGVMVLADDPGVRSNRLALLSRVASLFQATADISKLQE